MTREPPDLVGTTAAGKYRVVGTLGRGTMGIVYEAEGLADGARVALKVLRVDDQTIAARFLREAKTMSLFQHRNIVELLEVGALDDGTLYFAAELVRGSTLREQLAAGPLATRRALAIARQVLEALGHAHAMGVVHRDIKPENIMLADELVKILDFGVAKLIGDTPAVLGEGTLTITGYGALGTPFYMSPEAVLGRALDARADLYAVGALLFEMLVGKPPYDHEDVAVLMRMHAAAPIPSLRVLATDRAVSPELELVITEALAKKPELRFKSAAEMIDAIDAAVRALDAQAVADAEAEAARARAVAVAEPSSTVLVPDEAAAPAGTKTTDLFGALPLKAPAAPAPPAPASVVAPTVATPPGPLFAPPMPAAGARGPSALEQFGRKHRRVLLAGGGACALVIIIAIAVARGGGASGVPTVGAKPAEQGALAREASELIAAGHPARALERIEREDFGDAPDVFLVLGHARVASGRRLDGLAAYERALAADRALAGDAQVRANVERILATKDAAAGVVALELATRLAPPARDLVVAQANAGKVADVRRRARAIAERERLDGVDAVESWSLDLAQATTCEDRVAAVLQLRRTGDARALPALRRARKQRCVEREVAEAIAHLEARSTAP